MEGNNNTVLVDSNIIIYSAETEYEVLTKWLRNKNICVSDITRIEVLGYPNLLPEDKLYFEEFFNKCDVFSINKKNVNRAIFLKQQRKMSIGDAIIAATAMTNKMPLITAKTKDFEHIEYLQLMNPIK